MASSIFNQETKTPQFSDEQIKMAENFIKGKGINAEQAVRMLCTKRGIDVDSFMSQIKK